MKTKIFFLSIILLLLSSNIFAQKQSATEFVESFYEFHQTFSGSFCAEVIEAHKKWFTDELNELLQRELKREEEFIKENPTDKPRWGDGLSFAPNEDGVINGEIPKNVIKVGSVKIRKNVVLVEVKFFYNKVWGGGFIKKRKVELIKNSGGWLINDLIYSDGSKLTEDLKREKY